MRNVVGSAISACFMSFCLYDYATLIDCLAYLNYEYYTITCMALQ